MRKVYCVYCGKPMHEGEPCIRYNNFTGFFCSYRCIALNAGISRNTIVSDELVQEDKEANGIDWDE